MAYSTLSLVLINHRSAVPGKVAQGLQHPKLQTLGSWNESLKAIPDDPDYRISYINLMRFKPIVNKPNDIIRRIVSNAGAAGLSNLRTLGGCENPIIYVETVYRKVAASFDGLYRDSSQPPLKGIQL
jgi:hypothetical protein